MNKKQKITQHNISFIAIFFIGGCIMSVIRHFIPIKTEELAFWQELVIWAIMGAVMGLIIGLWLKYRSKIKNRKDQ